MSTSNVAFTLPCATADAKRQVERGFAALNWRVSSGSDGTIIGQEPVTWGRLIKNPATATAIVTAVNEHSTQVTIQGKNFGMGPLQDGHVRKLVENLRAAIERA